MRSIKEIITNSMIIGPLTELRERTIRSVHNYLVDAAIVFAHKNKSNQEVLTEFLEWVFVGNCEDRK